MKLLKLLLSALLISAINFTLFSQCNLIIPTDTTISCGGPLEMNATGISGLSPVLQSGFNGGTFGPGWLTTPIVIYTNPCGPSLDGTPTAWLGNVPAPRTMTTNAFDFLCGAEICFDLDFAGDDPCGGCMDCEDPDEPDEGVFFQYSIDGGLTWVDIHYFDPQPNYAAGTNPVYYWDNYCFTLPAAAWTSATILRWDQPIVTTSANDHWGIDNIAVTPTDCNFWYDWAHVPGSQNDASQIVSPNDTTVYYVTYTDGTTVCVDSLIVNVIPLQIDIVANPDTIDCGSCTDLSVDFLNGANESLVDNFDAGIDPLVWADIQSGFISTICGGGAVGNSLYFDGSGPNRHAQTVAIDATYCGNIDFCLFMGNTASGGAPCENNETGEDIILEYSIDAGITFVPIVTYEQSLWDGANYQQCFSEMMPAAAQTTSTIFRWRQVSFTAFSGSDNWSIDEVVVSCTPAVNYNWTTGNVNSATSATPIACPLADELYTVSVSNPTNGCSSSDTSTIFVNTCSCFFTQFDGTEVFQPGAMLDVNGSFEYLFSPTTGTIEVEATNGTGTYSQTFNPPFTNNQLYNYSITGIPNDGSTLTLDVYFSDSVSCSQSFDLVLPTDCIFVQFDGAVTSQPGAIADVNGVFEHLSSPSTGTLEVKATNGAGTYTQTFNAPFTDGQVTNYSITGINDIGATITLEIYFSDSLGCTQTFNLASTLNIEIIDEEDPCIFAPNPMFDEAQLIFNNESQGEVTITIVNERGQLVFETKTKDPSISIDGNEFRQGIYFYSVKSSNGTEDCSGKFAVTK